MRKTDRRFHVVLWGATGFTGKLVAQVFARTATAGSADAPKLSWALGGRDQAKLEAVRRELAAEDPALAELPILVGDARDPASLAAIAEQTRVVCTTVGPYARFGSELVAACAARGTDYCDLTGEVQWMRRMIDAHDARARETGARIVHTCGFDSIPSDLGVAMLQAYAREKYGRPCRRITALFGEMSGGFSGGTIASMQNLMEEIGRDRSVLHVVANPYALDPSPKRRGPDGPDQRGIGREPTLGLYTAPFLMASVNSRVVRRSNALLDQAYGPEFEYREVMSTGRGARGLVRAAAVVAGLGAFLASFQVPPLRRLVESRLPGPGEGPSPEARAKGFFVVRFVGEVSGDGPGPRHVFGRVSDRRDPGYGSTSQMLAQAALCLAFDHLPARGGVLTPASALGEQLLTRLRSSGMVWSVTDSPQS